jgi:carboxylesterase type B
MNLFNKPAPEESEDCLYLNVWSPATTPPTGGFPVMFWIYGGNLQFGTARMPEYDGENIAAMRGIVVVSINYRTNGGLSNNNSLG